MGAGQNVVANLCLKAGATSSPTTRVRVSVPEERNRAVQCILKFAVLLVTVTLAVLVVWITTRNERVQSSPFRRPPHIVFILADDLGWADLSYNGNPQIRTPNIDALAWNGVRLTRLYHHPLCTPSRAAIMTGRYPIHTGMQHFVIKAAEPRGLPLNLKLLPEWLNDLGYSSYMVGKWHLGFHKTEYTPTRRGFLSHVGSWSGACEYTTHEWATLGTTDYGLDFRRNLTLAPEDSGRYYTEIVTEEAVSLIKNHPVEKPMFLYVAHLAPHYGSIRVKLEAPAEYLEGYDFIGVRNREIYAGMVSALDKSVGKIFKALHERGMLNDTFLSFSSDNGAAATYWGTGVASSYPLRGEKSTLWEGGVHVPGFIWTAQSMWTGRGSRYDHIFHATDWLPTLYEMAGGEVSKLGGIDGVSHLRSLADPLVYPPRNEVLLNIDPIEGNEAIIHDSYKLVYGAFPSGTSQWLDVPGSRLPTAEETDLAHESCIKGMSYKILKTAGFSPNCGEGGDVYSTAVNCGNRNSSKVPCDSRVAPCLYNVNIDPCEYYNIANENPEIVLKLQARISAYKKGALKPSNLPNDPSSFPHNHDGAWVSWKDGSA
ncbi:arylsulfatase B isoform X2 [Rhipicephalus microplus]|uniref:arylsulfatase B isoform X2 n=1 Tax=Rhipicephalus microplus TaxID=6941 RepID=UPI003F6C7EB5